MEWYMGWLNATVWACFLPFVMVGAIFGVGDPSLVAALHFGATSPDDPPVYELIVYAYMFVLKSIMALMAFCMWPVMTVIMYGGQINNITEGQWGNILFMGIVGSGIGIWAALRLLPMVDEYFGVEPSQGISWAIRAWCFAGQVYTAVKVAKLGRTIIRKI